VKDLQSLGELRPKLDWHLHGTRKRAAKVLGISGRRAIWRDSQANPALSVTEIACAVEELLAKLPRGALLVE
jgi:hypothetical protein